MRHFGRFDLQGLRESNLRANILSEFIKNHAKGAINWGYKLFNVIFKKMIFRSVIVFLDVIVNQVGSQHELRTSEQQEQKC